MGDLYPWHLEQMDAELAALAEQAKKSQRSK